MAALFPAADHNSLGLLAEPAERIGFLNSEKNMLLESPRYSNVLSSDAAGNTDGILHVTIHHANNLQNICIYGNQDVYAKFSITHCQDAAYSTQPVKAGGKNPVFNQSLQIPVSRADSVLKCEIWMMSCLRTYLQDQLLGFVLVSLGGLFEKGKRTQDHLLTSTDLFYTPAGTVRLSLLFHSSSTDFLQHEMSCNMLQDSSNGAVSPFQSFQDVSMDSRQQPLCHDELNNVEFPDLDAVSENQNLVSLYLKMAAGDVRESPGTNNVSHGRNQEQHEDGMASENHDLYGAPFLQLGASLIEVDCEMSSCSGEEICSGVSFSRDSHFLDPASKPGNGSVDALISHPNILPCSATELSKAHAAGSTSANWLLPTVHHLFKDAQSPTSLSSGGGSGHSSAVEEEKRKGVAFSPAPGSEVTLITAPLLNASVENEVPVIQQQIVDLYMKSMQQFTEKMADLKLPLDVGGQDVVASRSMHLERASVEGKTDGQKLFYGSRAFF